MDSQQAQTLMNYLTGLWEGEFPQTCRVLEAVPNDTRDYKPDPKSRTAWELTVHLAGGDLWFADSIVAGAFNWNPDAEKQAAQQFPNTAAVAAMYKEHFPKRIAQIRAMSAADLTKTVDFFGMFQRPNVTYLGFANNHSMHHRGQLAAYIRAMGGKVPAIYGGSADEPMKG
jgi:uncharacterized damage-inducible protein DinB